MFQDNVTQSLRYIPTAALKVGWGERGQCQGLSSLHCPLVECAFALDFNKLRMNVVVLSNH